MSLPHQDHKVNKARYNLTKAERLEARVSYEQKNLFQHAADLMGRTLTDFIVSTLQEIALRVVQEHETLKLTAQDRQVFVQALLKPATPNKNLLKATQRYKKEVSAK